MKLLAKFFRVLCAVYTVTAMLFLLLNLAMAGSFDGVIIRPNAFLLIFPFSAAIALASLLYVLKGIHRTLRQLLHFVLCVGAAYLFLYLPVNADASTSGKFIMLLFFTAVYWAFMGGYLAATSSRRQKNASREEYKSIFKK